MKMDVFALSTIRLMKVSLLQGIRETFKDNEITLGRYERQFKEIKLPALDQSIKGHDIPTNEDVDVLLEGGKYKDLRKKLENQECEIFPSENLKLIIKMLNNTGMRIHELIRLRRDKCSVKKNKVYIKIHGKGNKWRENFIDAALYKEIIKTFPKHELLFYDSRHGEIETLTGASFEKVFHPYIESYRKRVTREIENLSIKLLGKSITAHDFRHKFATTLLKKGASLKAIAKWLGHASTETTNRFYVSDDLGSDELEKIWI